MATADNRLAEGVPADSFTVAFNTGSGIQFYTGNARQEDAPPPNFDYRGSKSVEAFKLTVDRLFAEAKRVYMWSCTFKEIQSIASAQEKAGLLCKTLSRSLKIKGIKVLELHPGGHGPHYHLLIPRWVSVAVLRRICRRCGFGRVHVIERLPSSRYYMAKHFAKQIRLPCLKHVRLWSAFGGSHWEYRAKPEILGGGTRRVLVRPHHCRVRDIAYNDRESEIYRGILAAQGKRGKIRWDEHREVFAQAQRIFLQEINAGRKLFQGVELAGRGAVNLVFN